MSSFYDDASLVVIPSGYKTSKVYAEKPTDGSGDLAFTRTGDTATRVNSAGLIEKVRTNLILRSQEFNNTGSWIPANGGTGLVPVVTANNATAPDGTNTAETIVFNSGAGTTASDQSIIYQSITLSSNSYTGSFFARVTSGTGQLMFRHAGGGSYTTANLTTTWQRFSSVESTAGATIFFEIGIRRGLNEPINASVTVEIWGCQLEVSDFGATPYIPTTTAAVSVGMVANTPRLDFLGSTCPRLILEPQRQNLVTFSEQLNNAAWLKINTTATANVVTSPDGYTNADKIIPANGNNIAVVYQSIIPAGTSTASIYAKAGEFGGIVIATGTTGAFFNLTTGQYRTAYNAAPTAYSITSVGNGWYRCSVTLTSAADNLYIGANDNVSNDLTVTGNGTSGIYIWGAQVEAGAYATSYIPTLAASATRGADYAAKTSASALIGQSEGVVFVDFEVTDTANFQSINVYNNNKAGNTISTVTIQFNLTQVIASIFYGNGTFDTITLNATGYGLNQRLKVAFRYKSGDLALYVNGVQKDTDATTYTAIGTKSEVFLGDPTVYFAYKGGLKINNYLQFTSALTNAQLAELTTL